MTKPDLVQEFGIRESRIHWQSKDYQQILRESFQEIYDSKRDVWSNEAEIRRVASIVKEFSHLWSPKQEISRLLDIGCGVGADIQVLAPLFDDWDAIDCVSHPQWEVLAYHLQGRFHCEDFLHWQPSKSYSVILDNGCLHHQHPKQLETYVQKVVQCLKGIYCLTLFDKGDEQTTHMQDKWGRYLHYFSEKEVRALMGNHGLKILDRRIIPRTLVKQSYHIYIMEVNS